MNAASSATAPTAKLTNVAVSTLPEAARTRPLTACCQARPTPARAGSRARASPAGSSGRSPTARNTAGTVSAAPASRAGVTSCRPDGPIPARSTTRLLADWPATTATVNTATPSRPTVSPWLATMNAPQAPPRHCHGRSEPSRRAARNTPRWRRPAGLPETSATSATSPMPNEITAAAIPSCSRTPSSPLIRDCTATAPPETTASPTAPARRVFGVGRFAAVRVSSRLIPARPVGGRRSRRPSRG